MWNKRMMADGAAKPSPQDYELAGWLTRENLGAIREFLREIANPQTHLLDEAGQSIPELIRGWTQNLKPADRQLPYALQIEALLEPGVLNSADAQKIYDWLAWVAKGTGYLSPLQDSFDLLADCVQEAREQFQNTPDLERQVQSRKQQILQQWKIQDAAAFKKLTAKEIKTLENAVRQSFVLILANQSGLLKSQRVLNFLDRAGIGKLKDSQKTSNLYEQLHLQVTYCNPLSILRVSQLQALGIRAFVNVPITREGDMVFYINKDTHARVEIPINAKFSVHVDANFNFDDLNPRDMKAHVQRADEAFRQTPQISQRLGYFKALSYYYADLQTEDPDQKRRYLILALLCDPTNAKANQNWAQYLWSQGQFIPALKYWKRSYARHHFHLTHFDLLRLIGVGFLQHLDGSALDKGWRKARKILLQVYWGTAHGEALVNELKRHDTPGLAKAVFDAEMNRADNLMRETLIAFRDNPAEQAVFSGQALLWLIQVQEQLPDSRRYTWDFLKNQFKVLPGINPAHGWQGLGVALSQTVSWLESGYQDWAIALWKKHLNLNDAQIKKLLDWIKQAYPRIFGDASQSE